jgi:hypothetical protein
MNSDKFKMLKDNPGALVNTDLEALEEYKIKRRNLLQQSNKNDNIDNIKQDVDLLKNEISDIKSLLLKVLEAK